MNYIIEANIGIVFFYGVYFLFLRNETDFAKQRAFLLVSIACSLLFPLIQLPSSIDVQSNVKTLMLPTFYVANTTSPRPVFDMVTVVYSIITLFFIAPLLLQVFRLYKIVRSESGEYHNNYYIIESNDNKPSWSLFRLIYIGGSNKLSQEDKELIMKHEMLHGQLYHSADMLFATLLCIVFWFNPFIWIYRKTLARVHEFEVDAIVAWKNGIGYTELLAKTALAANGLFLTNHFNQSFILKRINMINNIKSKISNWKFAALAMSVVIYFASVSCSEVDQREALKESEPWKGEVFSVVETLAEPKDGYPAFMNELNSVLKYPKSAKEKGVQGTVYVEFIVRPDGSLSDYKVVKGIDPDCDHAALVAVSKLKPWNAPMDKGKTVACKMTLPIKFVLG